MQNFSYPCLNYIISSPSSVSYATAERSATGTAAAGEEEAEDPPPPPRSSANRVGSWLVAKSRCDPEGDQQALWTRPRRTFQVSLVHVRVSQILKTVEGVAERTQGPRFRAEKEEDHATRWTPPPPMRLIL